MAFQIHVLKPQPKNKWSLHSMQPLQNRHLTSPFAPYFSNLSPIERLIFNILWLYNSTRCQEFLCFTWWYSSFWEYLKWKHCYRETEYLNTCFSKLYNSYLSQGSICLGGRTYVNGRIDRFFSFFFPNPANFKLQGNWANFLLHKVLEHKKSTADD